MLKDIRIKEVYNSEDDNILEDFYIPALQNAVSYDRAVGYFDAKVLTAAARGLSCFVDNGGYMRLIVGATLKDEEYEAIAQGYDDRELKKRLGQELLDSVNEYEGDLFENQLNTLSWFIENNKLDVKIALRRGGIYHEKIGIVTDANDDSIVFQGSANETRNALSPYNYESINVFKSWLPEFSGHIIPHMDKFHSLWNDMAKNTKVLSFTDITKYVLSQRISNIQKPSINQEIDLWQDAYIPIPLQELGFKRAVFVQ